MDLILVRFGWFKFGSDFDGSDFGDVVGLVCVQFCWVLFGADFNDIVGLV